MTDPSDVLRTAATRLRQRGRIELPNEQDNDTIALDAEPLVVWLEQSAYVYGLYEGRELSDKQIDRRVTKADRAALAFARLITQTEGA